MFHKKEVNPKCKNCLLYNKNEGICMVTVIQNGQYYHLPVKPNDECHWVKNGIDVKQIRLWSDGKNGYVETTET